MTPDDLLAMMRKHEDNFVEHKPEGVSRAELRQTVSAFANTVPEGRSAGWGQQPTKSLKVHSGSKRTYIPAAVMVTSPLTIGVKIVDTNRLGVDIMVDLEKREACLRKPRGTESSILPSIVVRK